MSAALQEATIQQQCKQLHLPAVAAQCARLAEQAVRERQTHHGYLEALLGSELEERERRTIERRLRDARLPRMKTLEEFDFAQSPKVSPSESQELATGDYIGRAEPVIFLGEPRACRTGHRSMGIPACARPKRSALRAAQGFAPAGTPSSQTPP